MNELDAYASPAPRVPRHVPTLTEVMVPDLAEPVADADAPAAPLAPAPAATAMAPAAPPEPVAPAAAATADAGAWELDLLLQRLGPELEREISEAIGRVLHEQMLGFNARVRRAVADVVRDAVVRAERER